MMAPAGGVGSRLGSSSPFGAASQVVRPECGGDVSSGTMVVRVFVGELPADGEDDGEPDGVPDVPVAPVEVPEDGVEEVPPGTVTVPRVMS